MAAPEIKEKVVGAPQSSEISNLHARIDSLSRLLSASAGTTLVRIWDTDTVVVTRIDTTLFLTSDTIWVQTHECDHEDIYDQFLIFQRKLDSMNESLMQHEHKRGGLRIPGTDIRVQ